MPPTKKRKITEESGTAVSNAQDSQQVDKESETEPSKGTQPDVSSVDKNQDRKERFKALQARAVSLFGPMISE